MQLTKIDDYFWSDLTVSPEAKNFINLAHPGTFELTKNVDYNTATGKPKVTLSDWDNAEKVEMGRFYGSVKNKDLRVIYNPREIHPWNHFSKTSSAIMSDFFSETLGAPTPLAGSNQLWFYKEALNGIGLIGFFMFILQIAYALLLTPFFASLGHPVPAQLPALDTSKAKTVFFGGLALGAIFSGASVMPLMQLNTKIFTNASMQNTTAWFSQPSTNQIMLWAIGNGLFTLILFFLSYSFFGKKNGVSKASWGLRINGMNLLKTLLLTITIVLLGYTSVMLVDMLFMTDFRFWTFAVKAVNKSKLLIALKYSPFFLIFYFAHSLAVNGAHRVKGQKPRTNLLYSILANTVGFVFMIVLQYAVMFWRGEAIFHPNLSWINILLLIPFVPILIVATIYSRKLYEKTGSIYLPALLNTILMTLITVANTTTITILR